MSNFEREYIRVVDGYPKSVIINKDLCYTFKIKDIETKEMHIYSNLSFSFRVIRNEKCLDLNVELIDFFFNTFKDIQTFIKDLKRDQDKNTFVLKSFKYEDTKMDYGFEFNIDNIISQGDLSVSSSISFYDINHKFMSNNKFEIFKIQQKIKYDNHAYIGESSYFHYLNCLEEVSEFLLSLINTLEKMHQEMLLDFSVNKEYKSILSDDHKAFLENNCRAEKKQYFDLIKGFFKKIKL